jgi:hypothetical protein
VAWSAEDDALRQLGIAPFLRPGEDPMVDLLIRVDVMDL